MNTFDFKYKFKHRARDSIKANVLILHVADQCSISRTP